MNWPIVQFFKGLLTLLALSNLSLCPVLSVHAQSPPPNPEHRVALVIGNSAYLSEPLQSAVNEATDMADKLRALGFDVITRYDLKTKHIGSTLGEFRSKLRVGGVALFFYVGHGLHIRGENYLPAVDAEIETADDVPNQSLAARQLLEVLTVSKLRLSLVFLEACRDNPSPRSFRAAAGGLERIQAPSGTLISFATQPGSVASDGACRNGFYTQEILTGMDTPDLPVEEMLKRVVSGVRKRSNGEQQPWTEGFIEEEFYFKTSPVINSTVIKAPASIEALATSGGATAKQDDLPTISQIYEAAKSGDLGKARTMIETVLANRPASAKAHFVSAELYQQENKYPEASKELDRAMQLDPSLGFAYPGVVEKFKQVLLAGPQQQKK